MAYIQATSGATTGTPLQVLSDAFGSNTVSGNAIIVTVGINSSLAAVTSITDTQGNTYSLAKRQSNITDVEIWYALNITGGASNIITANYDHNAVATVIAQEFSNINTSGALDQTAANGATGNGNLDSTATLTTAQANEILIGGGVQGSSTAVFTVGSGYSNMTTKAGSSAISILQESEVVSATGTYSATATSDKTSRWNMAIATFKSTGGTTTSTSSTSSSVSTSSTSSSISTSSTSSSTSKSTSTSSTSSSISTSSTSSSVSTSSTSSSTSISTSTSTSSTSSSISTSTSLSSTSSSISTSSTSSSISTSSTSSSISSSTSQSTSTTVSITTSTSSTSSSTSTSSTSSSTSTSISTSSTSTSRSTSTSSTSSSVSTSSTSSSVSTSTTLLAVDMWPHATIKHQSQLTGPTVSDSTLIDDTVVLVDDTTAVVGGSTSINPDMIPRIKTIVPRPNIRIRR